MLMELRDADRRAARQRSEQSLPYAAEDRFDDVLANALRERRWLEGHARHAFGESATMRSADSRGLYRRAFKVRAALTVRTLTARWLASVAKTQSRNLRGPARGGATDR